MPDTRAAALPTTDDRRERLLDFGYWAFVYGLGGFTLFYMIAPIGIALLMSFTDGLTLRFPPEGYSLRQYRALLDPIRSEPIHTAALNSLSIAAWTALGAMAVAAPAAFGMARLGRRSATALEPVLLSPLVLPSLVYSLAALLVISNLGFGPAYGFVVAGHIVVFAPLMYRTSLAVAQQIDPSQEEASTTLGAGRLRTFLRVTMPALIPGVLAGGFLVFMQSMDNVSVTLFLADPQTTVLPLRMFAMIEESLDPRVAAISGLLVLATVVLLIVVQRLAPFVRRR
jgi:putative spermidine/putrescine transport system permease protein